MSRRTHTYGPTCHLARSVTFSGSKSSEEIPHLKAQFFYSSPLPIDDPLSAAPTPSGSESKSVKHPPRPFSAYDNNALEEAWISLSAYKKDQKGNAASRYGIVSSTSEISAASKSEGKHKTKNRTNQSDDASSKNSTILGNTQDPVVGDSTRHSQLSVVAKSQNENESLSDSGSNTEYLKDTGTIKAKSGKESNLGGITSQSDEQRRGKQQILIESRSGQEASTKSDPADGKQSGPGKSDKNLQGARYTQADVVDDAIPSEIAHYTDELQSDEDGGKMSRKEENRLSRSDRSHSRGPKVSAHDTTEKSRRQEAVKQSSDIGSSSQVGESGMSGRPFLKLPLRERSQETQPPGTASQKTPSARENPSEGDPFPENKSNSKSLNLSDSTDSEHFQNPRNNRQRETTESETATLHAHGCKAHTHADEHADVPVGVSRLHLVELPTLQMKPIYWSPVHDIAAVTRGTWFYKDSMYPLEPAVANQLEMGFRELKPWSQTWKDELHSAIEVGAAGEEKIAHRLWPIEQDAKTNSKAKSQSTQQQHPLSTDPYCAARCFHGEASAEGCIESDEIPEIQPETKIIQKKYAYGQVIYKDSQNAFILKPSLQPSAYYNRKPLHKIMKGTRVGLHVVRGFDWKAWERLHPSNKSSVAAKAEEHAPVAGDADASKRSVCATCSAQEERPEISDLILVIHGIGQKLSERVESFHFTHAINSFRRCVNVELSNEGVQRVLRKDLGGVMVLPVNWRSNLSFEDGGPMKKEDKDRHASDFSMKDITLETIPAIRNLISDVMLDIPFYMSHHKPKMIQAVISEANRVYRLWCKNNPDFHQNGRVHIIAHSLGSPMALEVLSNQPTSVPNIDFHKEKANRKCFDFNTTNLFFVGSPAGFFLLLDKGKLTPRRGQSKPDAESVGNDQEIVGDAGTFGCLAVDNIYNIMHYNDPIAYRLNATVDPQYAASLKNAQVPSASTGFFESIGKAILSITPGASPSNDLAVGQVAKPVGVTRLPSQMEMEVHDFTREEIAEKKFLLLNDNGQVDWFLSTGGGPLEIQYLNMLSAHSSYWGSPDFVRMVVTEVGREPGQGHTLPNMRAVKVGRKS